MINKRLLRMSSEFEIKECVQQWQFAIVVRIFCLEAVSDVRVNCVYVNAVYVYVCM